MANRKNQTRKQSGNGPLARFRSYGIEATVWLGRDNKQKTITVKKTYKDDKGEYQETTTFFPDELPRLAMVANAAHAYCNLRVDHSE